MVAFYKRNGIEYAKTDGNSVRIDGKVQKLNQKYIGRVIDRDNFVFYNKDKGLFKYDPITGETSIADDSYNTDLKTDKRKKEQLLLDFGDVYFVNELIRSIGYDKVIDSVGYKNNDTFMAMLMYYIVSESANSHAQAWYEGSVARILFPDANVSSQRISDFLYSIGKEERQQNYFNAHINWLKDKISDDPAIICDSTGLPNDIDTYLKNFSNHNGRISRETRMTVAVQRDSGYPFLYRVHPGNIVDCTTLQKTIITLSMYGVETDLALLDAGYATDSVIDDLLDKEIDFVTRLSEIHSAMYTEVEEKLKDKLIQKSNLLEFNGRYIYMARTEVKGGKKGRTIYAYLGYDLNRHQDELHKAIEKPKSKRKTIEQMHNLITDGGYFILISSLPYTAEEILIVYYVRQLIEQYFDLSKGISRLIPLRGHSEEVIFGHLLLCQAAATINLYIQKAMNDTKENREDILMWLRNQKCRVYKSKLIPSEVQSHGKELYDKFNIHCPVSFKRASNGTLVSESGINF